MKQLLVMRHAKSSWKDESLSDFERPLNKRGRQDAPRMGRLLADLELTPQLILSSAARRARSTAEAVADQCDYEGELIVTRDLYMAGPEEYARVLQQLAGENQLVLVVGHNPGIEDFIEELSGQWERMPTAALALIETAVEEWDDLALDGASSITGVWRPKEIEI